MIKQTKITEILLDASDAASALKQIIAARKQVNQAFSIAFLAKRAGFASKGHLSDLISARRALKLRYAAPLANALRLDPLETEVFVALVQLDASKTDHEMAKRSEHLRRLRQALAVTSRVLPGDMTNILFVFEVFCAFSLLPNPASLEGFVRYFGAKHQIAIEAALAKLVEHGAVRQIDTKHFEVLDDTLIFGSSSDNSRHIEFLHESIAKAQAQIAESFDQRETTHFESTVISVRKSDYIKKLAEIKASLLKLQLDIHQANQADALIHFNVQIFPAGSY